MLEIELTDFSGYSMPMILEYLELQDETYYKLIISRTAIFPRDGNYSVFLEYHFAAFAGHRLDEICSSFSYFVPSPKTERGFEFDFITKETGHLASILFMVINIFYDRADHELAQKTIDDAGQFFRESYEYTVEPSTWGLLIVANGFLK